MAEIELVHKVTLRTRNVSRRHEVTGVYRGSLGKLFLTSSSTAPEPRRYHESVVKRVGSFKGRSSPLLYANVDERPVNVHDAGASWIHRISAHCRRFTWRNTPARAGQNLGGRYRSRLPHRGLVFAPHDAEVVEISDRGPLTPVVQNRPW